MAQNGQLHSGWSTNKSSVPLNASERERIIEVIQRNEIVEDAERQRVGRIIERVERIKQRAADCGPKFCRLCGQAFGFLSKKIICLDCRKPVCSACAVELHVKHGTNARDIWLCQICTEIREMWKKTGAWFYKTLPSCEATPQQLHSSMHELREPPRMANTLEPPKHTKPSSKHGIRVVDSSSDEENEDVIDGPRSRSHSNARRGSPPLERMNSLRIRANTFRAIAAPNEDGFLFRKLSSTLSLFSRQQSTLSTDQNAGHLNESSSHMKIFDERRRTSRCNSESSSYSVSDASLMGDATLTHSQTYREPPLGWLEVRLVYNSGQKTLDCTLFRARDLPANDIICLPDPYARLNIVSEWGQLKQDKWLQSKCVQKTRSPEFNETIRFGGVEPEELQGVLYVVLLDEDKFGCDFLGAGRVQLKSAIESSSQRTSVPLGAQDEICMTASSTIFTRGSILIGLCYNTKRRALVVQIKRCTNLIAMDSNGFSDPFVKVQLKPDAHRNKKHKTSVKWRNLNPVFNEEFSFETRPNELDKQSLVFTVWDMDLGKSNDFLGSLVIGYTSKGKRLKQWKDCIRSPDCFHEQWHQLSSDPRPHE